MPAGEGFHGLDLAQALPMLENLVPAQPQRTQLSRKVFLPISLERDNQRLALTSALGRLAAKIFSVRFQRAKTFWCCGHVSRRERSEKCGRGEIKKVGLLDESAGFDQAAGALLSLLILDASFLLGEAGLLLSEAAPLPPLLMRSEG